MWKYKSKTRKEIAGSGLGGEVLNECEQLLEDLIERYEESERRIEESLSDKKVQDQEDKKKAIDMRQKAMEMYGETRVHKDLDREDGSSKERKLRQTSFDMMTFLREKIDRYGEMKREELEAREHDREVRECDREAREREQ